MNPFIELIHEDIINNVIDDNPQAKQTNKGVYGVNCPVCGKPEARIYFDNPEFFRCHRDNHCGKTTHAKTVYPELWLSIATKAPATISDPKATARTYLEARGLNTELFEFEQGEYQVNGKTFPTVKLTQDSVIQHRLIDYSGKDKSRNTEYKGKVYQTDGVANSNEVYVTEGIFNALSLAQSGHPAIATYSSGSIPEDYFKANKDKTFVIAFDNDRAGRKGAVKLQKLLEELGITNKVAFTPRGKDWNDLLVSDQLNDQAIDKAFWRGKLELVETSNAYFEVYREQYTKCYLKVFEFNLCTYIGTAKQGKTELELSVKRIADCSFKLLHSTIDDSDNNRQKMTHIIEIESAREGAARFDLDANEITRIDSFKSAVANHRQIFNGTGDDLNHLASHLFNQSPKPPKLRALSVVGYDDKSKWFVYPKFAYDLKGCRVEVNKDGYFDKVGVRPFNNYCDPITNKIEGIDVVEVVRLIHAAYGNNGLLSFGFYISTTFSHDVFKHFNFFPFLSLHGDPHSGKSGLSLLLNRITFRDSEGHAMTKTNTAKGELRKIGQGSSVVMALLEGRKDATRFDYDSILPLYNRNSLYTRATTSQDNRTHDLPLKAAMSFVWNHECFTLKAAKERVISLPFLEKDLTEATGKAWDQLQTLSVEQLAGIGHFILSNRNHFEGGLVPEIVSHSKTLKANGIKVSRIADNSAIALAGITTLLDLLGIAKDFTESLFSYTTKIAAMKLESARTDNPLADLFLETVKMYQDLFLLDSENNQFFHLPRTLAALAKEEHHFDRVKLIEGLKSHEDFIEIKNFKGYGTNKSHAERHYVFKHTFR